MYQLSSSHYRQNALYLKTRDVVTKVVTRCTKMNALLPSLKPVPGIIMLVLRAPGTYHKPTHWSCPHIANPYTGAAITSQTHTLELPTHRKSIHRSCHHIINPHTGAAHTSQIHTQELPSHHNPTHWSCPHITNPHAGAAHQSDICEVDCCRVHEFFVVRVLCKVIVVITGQFRTWCSLGY